MQHTSKYTVILLTAIASLASCSENNMPEQEKATDKYIVFGTPSLGLNGSVGDFADNTRANATLATSVDEFQVWAYCIPNTIKGVMDPDQATTPWVEKYKFFTSGADVTNLKDTRVTPSAANNYNNGTLTKWNDDSDALYTFIGLAGQKSYRNYDNNTVNNFEYSMENASAVTGSEHGPRLTITLNPNVKNEKTDSTRVNKGSNKKPNWVWEYKYSIVNIDRATQGDPMVASVFDVKHESGKVKLSFSHIMTALRFKIQNFSDKKLTITSIKFDGKFYKKAVIDFSTLTPKMSVDVKETYNGPFAIIDEAMTIQNDQAAFAGGEDNYLLLLPNPAGTTNDNDGNYVLGTDKKIEITYHFDNDPDKTIEIPVNLNYLPKPNTKHTAYLNFVGSNLNVIFQADEKTWENGSDNEYTIQ